MAVETSPVSPMKILLTTEEVADLLGLSPRTVTNWRYLQVGPPHVKHRRRVYYRASDLKAYIEDLPAAA